MRHFENILMPVDFSSCARQAALNALELAQKHQANSHLLHASPQYLRPNASWRSMLPNEQEILFEPEARVATDMTDLVQNSGLSEDSIYKVQIKGATETASIMAYARENPIDLIVMGRSGQGGRTRTLGSVTRKLLNHAPCPVMAIKEDTSETKDRAYRVLMPVNPVGLEDEELLMGLEMACCFDAGPMLFHVAPENTSMSEAISAMERLRNRIRSLFPALETGIEIGVAQGEIGQETARFARSIDADLILMTRGRNGKNRPVLGNILQKAHCSVCVAPF